jgi:hypothetical protein
LRIQVDPDRAITRDMAVLGRCVRRQGKAVGLPPKPVTNLTLTTASTAATEAQSITNAMSAQQPATSVDVEVTGFGGDDTNAPEHCVVRPGNGCVP